MENFPLPKILHYLVGITNFHFVLSQHFNYYQNKKINYYQFNKIETHCATLPIENGKRVL